MLAGLCAAAPPTAKPKPHGRLPVPDPWHAWEAYHGLAPSGNLPIQTTARAQTLEDEGLEEKGLEDP